MGRRSLADTQDLYERIFRMHTVEKKTFVQIAEELREEGYSISRESARNGFRTAKEQASEIMKCNEEARVIMDEVRKNPTNTDLMEVIVARLGGMLYREASVLDEINFKDSVEMLKFIKTLSDAQVKLTSVRMKYQDGVENAKTAVVTALKTELKEHPDLLERLTMIVGGLVVEDK